MNAETLLTVLEHTSSHYSPRTWANATSAQWTLAFARDFTTPGEALTHKAAGDRYSAIALEGDPVEAARSIFLAIKRNNVRSVNIAGNGIVTLTKHGWTQPQVNQFIYDVLSRIHAHWPLEALRSGGQTGGDVAGCVAGVALGIPTTALLPKGFRQRWRDRIDTEHTEADIRQQIMDGVAGLSRPAA